jgi:hypothetical protein
MEYVASIPYFVITGFSTLMRSVFMENSIEDNSRNESVISYKYLNLPEETK